MGKQADAKPKKSKQPPQQQGSAPKPKIPKKNSGGIGLAGPLVVVTISVALGVWWWLHDSKLLRIAPARVDVDHQGEIEIYDYNGSFAPVWASRSDDTDPCWRTDDWHGVPFSVEKASEEELDMEALTAHLLEKEKEWMQFPIRDWKDKAGSAYNTTSARYDQYNVLADAETVPVVAALKRFIKRSAMNYLSCVASSPGYFDREHPAGEYFSQILTAIPPTPLYIMCWVNVFRHNRKHANALHWHVHNWPFQGYLSVTSEGSGTQFRSNVRPKVTARLSTSSRPIPIVPDPNGPRSQSPPARDPSHHPHAIPVTTPQPPSHCIPRHAILPFSVPALAP